MPSRTRPAARPSAGDRAARRRGRRAPSGTPRPRATTGRWRCWMTRSTIAPIIADGSRRPHPATHQTGVPLQRATAATRAEPVAATTWSDSRASASIRTRSAAAIAIDAASVGHELALDVDPLESLHERRPLVPGVDGQHADVAATGHGHADEVGPADRHDGGAVGDARRSARRSSRRPRSRRRRRGPRPAGRRSSACGRTATTAGRASDGARRSGGTPRRSPDGSRPESTQRAGGLPHQRLGIGAPGPGDVPQALDGMHALTVPTAVRSGPGHQMQRVGVGSRALATVAPRGDEPTAWTSCWLRSVPRRARSRSG